MKTNALPTSSKPRYLTKSRFKLAMECPAKLFFTGKDKIYANQKLEDSFLASLAEGGFQVGELAKCYFPGGSEVTTLDYEAAIQQTNQLLERENVVIFEAAIRHEQFFIRTDILVKTGRRIDLIEVKAKSYDPTEDGDFIGSRGGIMSEWKPYLLDIAFQKYVVSKAFPQSTVYAALMLADKTAICSTDGLNQKFKILKTADGRKGARLTTPLTAADLSPQILRRVDVDAACKKIYNETLKVADGPAAFSERLVWLAKHYARDEKVVYPPSTACAKCEFQTTPTDEAAGKKSGFKECWSQAFGWTDKEFDTPNILDIWNYRGKSKLIAEQRVAMAEVTKEDINPEPDGKPGLAMSERQWLQVEKVQNNDTSVWFDRSALAKEMRRWKFPLHFIDFETTRVAIPFNRGRHPYEAIAFQFSHHLVQADGRVEHKGQYLNAQPGTFPNYDFVRALCQELADDKGSIFRYSPHENSMLVAIDKQLAIDPTPPADAQALKSFIRSITTATKDSIEQWHSERAMVDLWDMVKRYYYAPNTNGSNSIKQVLPAVLAHSKFLQDYYSEPIYGAIGGIPSKNFKNHIWLKVSGGQVVDPYKQLPKLFEDVSDEDFEKLSNLDLDDELREGGAAMTAYARLQFEDLPEMVRHKIETGLLRYCELDTLAMVMIYQAWRTLVSSSNPNT